MQRLITNEKKNNPNARDLLAPHQIIIIFIKSIFVCLRLEVIIKSDSSLRNHCKRHPHDIKPKSCIQIHLVCGSKSDRRFQFKWLFHERFIQILRFSYPSYKSESILVSASFIQKLIQIAAFSMDSRIEWARNAKHFEMLMPL